MVPVLAAEALDAACFTQVTDRAADDERLRVTSTADGGLCARH